MSNLEYDPSIERSDEEWVLYTCADCDPTLPRAKDEEPSEYEKPYVIAVPTGEPCPDYCPRCGDYLPFIDSALKVAVVRAASKKAGK